MVYPATPETHVNATDNVTEYAAEHVNWGYGVMERIQDYVGLEGAVADADGDLTAQIKQLKLDMETVFGIALWGGGD